MTYMHGRQTNELAARLERARQHLAQMEARAAQVKAEANKAAHDIITRSITEADAIRARAESDAAQIRRVAVFTAEQETARIRERAYLEGRARIDQQLIFADQREERQRFGQHLLNTIHAA